MNKAKQQGFTLIELIIVIVILGILAVTASPKFLDMQTEAKASTVAGLAGGLKGGANILYSKALVTGAANGTSAVPVAVSGVNTVFGFPEASVAALAAVVDSTMIAGSTSAVTADWEVMLDGTGVAATTARIYPAGNDEGTAYNTDDKDCYVEYVEPTASGETATITYVTTDC